MHFNHIILTRFNLQYEQDSTKHLDPDWLRERIGLFRSYCVPSVQSQTCRAFRWLILCDEHTPMDFRAQLQDCLKALPQAELRFCGFRADINDLYREIGKEAAGGSTLVSTRLDNDDMIACTYVEQVQTYVEQHPEWRGVISFREGIQYFKQQEWAYRIGWVNNHFLTFVEDAEGARTCIGMDHTQIPASAIRSMNAPEMWCEIVHGGNICNDYCPAFEYHLGVHSGAYPIPFPETKKWKQLCFLAERHVSYRMAQIRRLLKRCVAGRRF